ncbi:MAG: TadE/TadG family type IV pilus assembly protein, partial [Ktedonobacterales bacterium]
MACSVHGRLDARACRRQLARLEHARARAHRRRQKGQTLIIFALSVTVLLGLAGLVIDVARAYDLYGKMQRAADAGALAGVLYLPTSYNSARTPGDGQSAVSRAVTEVYKDGFGTGVSAIPASNPCPAILSTVEIAVCQLTTNPTDLEVTITERLNVVLLSGLGLGPITLQAHSQAEYLPPVQIGSRESYFGDQMECSSGNSSNSNFSACDPGNSSANHAQYFVASMTGPADLKESGDPYVNCEEGPSALTPAGADPGTDGSYPYNAYNGYSTNHPQWSGSVSQRCGRPVPGGNPGNPDYQPDGYNGPATSSSTTHPGGYNYEIYVSGSISSASLLVFNPYYIPRDGANALDQFVDDGSSTFYEGPNGEGITNFNGYNYDAPLLYFNTTISLYSVNSLYDRTSDTLIASQVYQPYDDLSWDLFTHGCSSGKVYNPIWNGQNTANTYHNPGQIQSGKGCVTPPSCALDTSFQSWCPFNATLTTGAYRLVVEATGLTADATNASDPRGYDYNSGPLDGWGSHSYGVKLCTGVPASAVNCPNGAKGAGQYNNTNLTIFGWNNIDVVFEQTLGNANPNQNYPQTSCVSSTAYRYACLDLGCIPSAYAGRTVTVGLFDPGDAPSGDMYLAVVPPSGSKVSVQYPSFASTAKIDGDTAVQVRYNNGYRAFNGLWLSVNLQLSSSYQGDCETTGGTSGKSGWFQLAYMSNNGSPHDKLTISFSLVGSPDHLVPPYL